MKTVEVAVEAYYAEEGVYPSDTMTELLQDVDTETGYMKTIPDGISFDRTSGVVSFTADGRCDTTA